jgi:hypothetical protein
MKHFIISALAIGTIVSATSAFAGPCTYPSDRASDGSRCGDRASTVRLVGNKHTFKATAALACLVGPP